MKKFDRVTSILIHLQTRQLVRAKDLAELFDVAERTIYRDIRTLAIAAKLTTGLTVSPKNS